MASKVAADLRQLTRHYGRPPDEWVEFFIEELAILLPRRLVESVDYGFQRDGKWVLVLRYTVREDGDLTADSRSGSVPANVDVRGTEWMSLLRFSEAWRKLTEDQRKRVEESLPFHRTTGAELATVNGVWVAERVYSSGGVAMTRKVFRPA